MPASTRDLWLVIKAQDQASRALSVFSRSVGNAGHAVRIAQLEVQRANQQNVIAQRTQVEALGRSEVALLANERANLRNMRSFIMSTGATQNQVNAIDNLIRVNNAQSLSARRALIVHQQGTIAIKQNVNAIDQQIRSLHQADTQASLHAQTLKRLGGVIDGASRAAQSLGFAFVGIGATISGITAPIEATIIGLAKLGIQTAASYEMALTAIKAIAPAGTDVEALFQRLAKLAIESPVFQVDDIVLFTQKLTSSGVSIAQTERLLRSLSRIFLVSGMDTDAAGRALVAFSQINAKGKLQAEELTRQLGNAMPNALKILSEGMGVTIEKFMEMQESGEISAEEVFNAIIKIGESGKYLEGTNDVLHTMRARWQQLKEGFTFNLAEVFRKHSKEIQSFIEQLEPVGEAVVAEFDRVLPRVMALLFRFGRVLQYVAGWYKDLSPKAKNAVSTFITFGGAIITFIGGASILIGVLAAIVGGIVAIGTTAWLVAIAVGAVALAFIGLGVGIYKAAQNSKEFRQLLKQTGDQILSFYNDTIKPTFEGIQEAYKKHIEPSLEKLWKTIKEDVIPAFREFMDGAGGEFLQQMKEIGKVIVEGVVIAFIMIKWAIETFLIPALEKASKFYKDHKEQIDQVVHYLAIFGGWLVRLSALLTLVFGGTLGVLVIASIVAFIGFIVLSVSIILGWIDIIKIVWGWLKSLWGILNDAAKAVRDFGMDVIHWFEDLPKKVGDAISGLGDKLYKAGVNAVQSLIDGLRDKAGDLGKAVGAIAGIIADHFPGSPVKTGPLSGHGEPFKAGARVAKNLSMGVLAQVGTVANASNVLASQFNYQANSPNFGGLGSSYRGNRSVNQEFNITTQEISPQKHAAELGWLVKNRVGVV